MFQMSRSCYFGQLLQRPSSMTCSPQPRSPCSYPLPYQLQCGFVLCCKILMSCCSCPKCPQCPCPGARCRCPAWPRPRPRPRCRPCPGARPPSTWWTAAAPPRTSAPPRPPPPRPRPLTMPRPPTPRPWPRPHSTCDTAALQCVCCSLVIQHCLPVKTMLIVGDVSPAENQKYLKS